MKKIYKSKGLIPREEVEENLRAKKKNNDVDCTYRYEQGNSSSSGPLRP
ncbi:hypothetical protein NXW62_06485 [Bacteroides fragilis]|nr:hypothetical protein [Bacteroides fragilis]